jgi:radical SAM superfamily enzyme YgiQ (UPF0313 family)
MLQPPSPPYLDVGRDFAGGFGVAIKVSRNSYGHEGAGFMHLPYVPLASSTSVLEREGYSPIFLDAQAEKKDLRDVLKFVEKNEPDVIIAVINLPSIYGDLNLLKAIKQENSNIKIIGIGTVCKVLTQEVLKDGIILDYAVCGEPESILPELINRVKNSEKVHNVKGIAFLRNGSIIRTPERSLIDDLDSIPFPAYHLMPMDRYKMGSAGYICNCAPIYASKGCPFQCSYYCPYPLAFGNKIRYRSPANVVAEIEYLVKEFNVEGIVFRDQTFTLNPKHTEKICQLLIEKRLNITWICETRADRVSDSLLKMMKKAGCISVIYGLETGDPKLLYEVGKPGVRLSKFFEAVKMTKKHGMFAHVHVIIGLPGENWRTIKNTLMTLFKLRVDNADFNIVTPYPGTGFFEEVKKEGLLLTEDWSNYTGLDPVLKTETMSSDDLKKAQQYLDHEFRFGAPLYIKMERSIRQFKMSKRKREKIMRFIYKKIFGKKNGRIYDK